jgi:hypothetical protein
MGCQWEGWFHCHRPGVTGLKCMRISKFHHMAHSVPDLEWIPLWHHMTFPQTQVPRAIARNYKFAICSRRGEMLPITLSIKCGLWRVGLHISSVRTANLRMEFCAGMFDCSWGRPLEQWNLDVIVSYLISIKPNNQFSEDHSMKHRWNQGLYPFVKYISIFYLNGTPSVSLKHLDFCNKY